jgi:methionine synthase II (cobalamin-independent)
MLKTVVGSFPPKNLPLEKAIQWAVDLQLNHHLDVVTDGEQRTDMITYFGSLPGLGINPSGPYIRSKVLPYDEPQKHFKLEDLRFVKAYLKKRNKEDVKAKVSITGPITLGFACACNRVEYYKGLTDNRIYSDFASALKPLIEEVAKNDCYIQIDEPSLSIRVMDPAKAVQIVNQTISGLPNSIREEDRLIVHVCGSLSASLFAELVKLNAPILSVAFAAPNVRSNLDVVTKSLLASNGKKLGAGCVSVQTRTREEVETFDQVAQRLKTLEERVGEEQIALVHPDCGMRPTGEEAVELILDRVVSSAEYFKKRKL